jgi:CRP/FNR family transcriptional regulator
MHEEIKYAYLKGHPLFSNVQEQKIVDACSATKVKTVYRGETLNYGDGEYSKIYLLIKGKIKITECNEPDNELIKDILTAPDVLGDLGLECSPPIEETAEALTDNTVVCSFNVPVFKMLLQENPVMAMSFANIVNKKLKKLEHRHYDLVFRDAKSRLIRFIKFWAQSDGDRVGEKIILANYLTHSDIAAAISTSRQSVNTLLNELRESGLIFYNRKTIELNNVPVWN